MRWLPFAIVLLVLSPTVAASQTVEQYQSLCGTADGREMLISALDSLEVYDIRMQAQALGQDEGRRLREAIQRRCAYYVPGTENTQIPVSSWEFQMEDLGAPGPGIQTAEFRFADPPRCGPYCAGEFRLTVNPRWEVCRLVFRSDYASNGPWRRALVGGQVKFIPIVHDSLGIVHGFRVTAEAHRTSYVQLRDIRIDAVDPAMSPAERAEIGCASAPEGGATLHIGRPECREDHDPDAFRHRDDCTVVHRAMGSRLWVRRYTMRKIIVSKPAGATGAERILQRNRGSPVGTEIILLPGQRLELLSKSGDSFTDHSVEIITISLGEGGVSRFNLSYEWFRP